VEPSPAAESSIRPRVPRHQHSEHPSHPRPPRNVGSGNLRPAGLGFGSSSGSGPAVGNLLVVLLVSLFCRLFFVSASTRPRTQGPTSGRRMETAACRAGRIAESISLGFSRLRRREEPAGGVGSASSELGLSCPGPPCPACSAKPSSAKRSHPTARQPAPSRPARFVFAPPWDHVRDEVKWSGRGVLDRFATTPSPTLLRKPCAVSVLGWSWPVGTHAS